MTSKTSRSVYADPIKLARLRHRLGWTQMEAAVRAGYSERVIRKLESRSPVRRQTLRDVIECYLKSEQPGKSKSESWTDYLLSEETVAADSGNDAASGDSDIGAILVEYFREVYERRRLEAIDQYVHAGFELVADGSTRAGIEFVRARAKKFLDAFDPIEIRVEKLVTQGSTVILTFVATMKHVGDFLSIPPTGRRVTVRNCSIAEFDGNVFIGSNDQTDIAHLMAQIRGELPPVV